MGKNITLLLNTAVYDIKKKDAERTPFQKNVWVSYFTQIIFSRTVEILCL
jgi:hypothetical protein